MYVRNMQMIVVRNAMLGPPGLLQILQIAFPVTDYAERCYVQVMFEMGERDIKCVAGCSIPTSGNLKKISRSSDRASS